MATGTAGGSRIVVAQVAENRPLCRDHWCIELVTAGLPASEPGQFVQVDCRSTEQDGARELEWTDGTIPALSGRDWRGQQPLLRRPFSIADRWDGPEGISHVVLIVRVVGPATGYLARLRSGASVNLIGPLGRGFRIPSVPIPAVLLGGGVGVPPLLYLARRLAELGWSDVTGIFGAGSADLIPLRLSRLPASDGIPTPCIDWPCKAGFSAIITTDDGSLGLPGRVTDGLVRWHQQRRMGTRQAMVFACGPEAMLKTAAALTRKLGLHCQLCVERLMGCGLGTCLSCVIRRRDPDSATGWRWALTCTEGPVFDRDELVDYASAATS
jgi:dihydroorotate dehydrogenase electron transfer subunit